MIHYKFKHSKTIFSAPIDGNYISVLDLKRKIAQKHKLYSAELFSFSSGGEYTKISSKQKRDGHFVLHLYDLNTQISYMDDRFLLQKGMLLGVKKSPPRYGSLHPNEPSLVDLEMKTKDKEKDKDRDKILSSKSNVIKNETCLYQNESENEKKFHYRRSADSYCLFCKHKIKNPVIVTCCYRMYCSECLSQTTDSEPRICQVCSSVITPETQQVLSSKIQTQLKERNYLA